ncbi:MAG: hypothetical protein M3290_13135, partial [Actinomycetota bacterium]|nr:hypothetical protein [Actinomycetota bacterium]
MSPVVRRSLAASLTLGLLSGAGLAAALPHGSTQRASAPGAAGAAVSPAEREEEATGPEDAFLTQRLMGGGVITPQVIRSIDRQRRAVGRTTRAYTPA